MASIAQSKGEFEVRCKTCKKKFLSHFMDKRFGFTKTCSSQCKGKLSAKNIKNKKEANFRKGLAKVGEKNPQWQGNKVGYKCLHKWVQRNKPQPYFCDFCKKAKGYDWANISQKYKRDLFDWEWLCRKCHMLKDGRIKKLIQRNQSRLSKAIQRCKWCNKERFLLPSKAKKIECCSLRCAAMLREFRKNPNCFKKIPDNDKLKIKVIENA